MRRICACPEMELTELCWMAQFLSLSRCCINQLIQQKWYQEHALTLVNKLWKCSQYHPCLCQLAAEKWLH